MRLHVVCFCIFATTAMNAQNEYENPYKECLKLYLRGLKERNIQKDTIYLQPNDYQNFSSEIIEGTFLRIVDEKFVEEKTRKGKKIGILNVQALIFDKNFQSISVVHFMVSRKKSHYNFVNSGGLKVILHYDCEQRTYKYEKVPSH